MELVPQGRNARLTAALLAIIALILAYLLLFHWFVLRHVEYAAELGDLSEQLGRFEAVAAQREPMEALLREIREDRQDMNLFLPEADFNEAAAAMSDRLSQTVSTQAEDDCQIVSRQPVRPRVEERYQKVTVNVRMRCGIDDLATVLYSLETSVPMVITDEVTIIKPRARRRPGSSGPEPVVPLDIRFNMSGYLRESA